MVEKFYTDASGHYLGSFDGAEPTDGAVETPTAPAHAGDFWNGFIWSPCEPTYEEKAAAIWSEFNNKADALATRIIRARLFDGPGLAAAESQLQAEYAALNATRNAALDTLEE